MALPFQQLLMASFFNHLTLVQYDDFIRIPYG
jgi:hypothetical protein